MSRVTLTVNGAEVTAEVEPRTQLADFLREQCLLTGTHLGCEHGVCGACTVLLDDAPARSCIAYAAACQGTDIRTIEGLEDDPLMRRLRAAFNAEHGLQCGYCTPGMLVTARDIVLRLPDADDDRIRVELAGNLCRCTGYAGIVRAIRRVLGDGIPNLVAPAVLPSAMPPSAMPPAPVAATAVRRGTPSGVHPEGPVLRLEIRIARPRGEIWSTLHDPAVLAACVPGARVISARDGQIEGEISIALGPITAVFTGIGSLALDEATQRATLSGSGHDTRSNTSLSGTATVTLEDAGPAATVASLAVTYALRGPLAQLARGPIVQTVAQEMATTVARNLERRLAGDTTAAVPRRLSAVGMLGRILWQWLRRLLGAP